MARAPSASPKKAQPASPKTKHLASPKKSKPSVPGIRKRQKEWLESLTIWPSRPDFKHPEGTYTVLKGNVKKKFPALNDQDLQSLPHECRISDKTGNSMKLYSYAQLRKLATQKCVKLQIDLEVEGVIYHSQSGSGSDGSVSIVSLKNPPILPAWMEHLLRPNPPPLKLETYTQPQAATADPEEICWTPSKISGPVTVDDACRLYCLTPNEIRDLSDHSKWIDLATVAKRALTLHGGFHAHEALVLQRRDEEEAMLTRTIHDAWKRKSHFSFSPIISKQWENADYDPSRKERVAVFYPITYFSDDDYGCDWNWVPRTSAPLF
ncbi:hypothetical protein C8R43DRAFT_1109151 [Mycena crocata]|nr:hypothetical protein C8R43DRAFT_1109151 [Mycena crocata]